jgi:hypothetical protein
MEKFYPSQLIKLQDVELISILENYTNYSESTIIFTYSEFTRRTLRHTVLILSNIEEFEKKYLEFDNYDINTSILKWNQKDNNLSDAELDLSKLEQEIIQTDRYEKSKTRCIEINPRFIISAGKDLKSIIYVIILIITSTVIAFIGIYNTKDFETISIIYKILGIVGLVGWFIILLKLYSAGSNLVNSVNNK